MNYTEEEKKAIEDLKKLKKECIEKYKVELDEKDNIDKPKAFYLHQQIEAIHIVLNLLEKQQKEIEELKYKYKKYGKVLFTEDAIKENYVSKNEIREKIKDLRYNESLGFEQSFEETFKIEVLEELLGE